MLSLSLPKEEGAFMKRVLGPETSEMKRCRFSWKEQEDAVCLVIEAEDMHSLRAAFNSYMRWADVALCVLRMSHDSRVQ